MSAHPEKGNRGRPEKVCYWCGAPATSKDHVPPKSLFPPEKSVNLHTVPACEKHNETMSPLDDRFKFYIQAIASDNKDAFGLFKTKTLRGLGKSESRRFAESLSQDAQWVEIEGKPRLTFRVDPIKQIQFFEKLVRGAYFVAYQNPVAGTVHAASPQFLVPDLEYDKLKGVAADFLSTAKQFNSANPDIFRFKHRREMTAHGFTAAILIVLYDFVEILGFIDPTPPDIKAPPQV
jgi:hypothetical protein